MRLNVYIAKSGLASRRKADSLISGGEVTVNGRGVNKPFYQVKENDKVRVSGKRLELKKHIYLLFNKPKGVTTTLNDRFAEKTIADFIPKQFQGIYPVGRLDKNSSGLLILTNDGDFCYQLTHPKFSVEKEYLVSLRGILTVSDRQKTKQGVRDEGELLRVKKIKVLRKDNENTLCKVIITEGKKRHLRRLFKQLGYSVGELQRVRMGSFSLGSLKPGQYKPFRRSGV